MNHPSHPTTILAFVGLSGAGKSEAVNHVARLGIPKVYAGGILYDEMRRRGIAITPQSQAEFRKAWREEAGKDIIIRTAAEQMQRLAAAGQRHILFDGLYSWTEYKYLTHHFPGELVVAAIVAPKQLRHRRLAQRPERPFTAQEAIARDWSEIEDIEKGGPIAIADHFISNSHDLTELHQQVDALCQEIGWM